jgi:hypothetical protein
MNNTYERVQFRDKSKPPRPETTQTHLIIVSTSIGSTGKPLPSKFDARIDERLIVEQSRTPFVDGARALLKDNIASPGDLLIMRHAGSNVDALRASVGIAAGLTIAEDGPRFAKWTPPETRWRAE